MSEPPFDTLNVSVSAGDAPERVWENRRLLLEAAGVRPRWVALGNQVHGDGLWWVAPEDVAGRGLDWDGLRRRADGLVTRIGGVALMSIFADCPVVVLHDAATGTIALVHSGWRGTLRGIARRVVRRMKRSGVRPEDIRAGLTPSIGACCFEVGESVLDAFERSLPAGAPGPGAVDRVRRRVDLARVIRWQLEAEGVPPEGIEVDPVCTACRPDLYFSHRGEGGRTGRNGVFAIL